MKKCVSLIFLMAPLFAAQRAPLPKAVVREPLLITNCDDTIEVFGQRKSIREIISTASESNPYLDLSVWNYECIMKGIILKSLSFGAKTIRTMKLEDYKAVCDNKFVFIHYPKSKNIHDNGFILLSDPLDAQKAANAYKEMMAEIGRKDDTLEEIEDEDYLTALHQSMEDLKPSSPKRSGSCIFNE